MGGAEVVERDGAGNHLLRDGEEDLGAVLDSLILVFLIRGQHSCCIWRMRCAAVTYRTQTPQFLDAEENWFVLGQPVPATVVLVDRL